MSNGSSDQRLSDGERERERREAVYQRRSTSRPSTVAAVAVRAYRHRRRCEHELAAVSPRAKKSNGFITAKHALQSRRNACSGERAFKFGSLPLALQLLQVSADAAALSRNADKITRTADAARPFAVVVSIRPREQVGAILIVRLTSVPRIRSIGLPRRDRGKERELEREGRKEEVYHFRGRKRNQKREREERE